MYITFRVRLFFLICHHVLLSSSSQIGHIKRDDLQKKLHIVDQSSHELEGQKAKLEQRIIQLKNVITLQNQKLNTLKIERNGIRKVDIDALLHNQSYVSLRLTPHQYALWYNLDTMQRRYNMIIAMMYDQSMRAAHYNHIVAYLPEDDPLRYRMSELLAVSGIDHLVQSLMTEKNFLQESIYAQDIQEKTVSIQKVSKKIIQALSEQKNLNSKIRKKQTRLDSLLRDRLCLNNQLHEYEERLDQLEISFCKKWERLVRAFWVQHKKSIFQDCARCKQEGNLMHAEDIAMHTFVQQEQDIEKERLLAEWYMVKKASQEQAELEEINRRIAQSRIDKEQYLQQLRQRHVALEQKKQLAIEHTQRQKEHAYAVQSQREELVRKEQARHNFDKLYMDKALQAVAIESNILDKIIHFRPRLSLLQFIKKSGERSDVNRGFGLLLKSFANVIKKYAQGAIEYKENTISVLETFDDLYANILDSHQQLVQEGMGISYYMSLDPRLYQDILNSYVQLQNVSEGLDIKKAYGEHLRLLQELQSKKEELNLLKLSYSQALRNSASSGENKALCDQLLLQLKDKKNDIEQLTKNCLLQEQVYVFSCLLKTCGVGGILDPSRFIDRKFPYASSQIDTALYDDIKMRFVILSEYIDDVMNRVPSVADEQIDPILKISQIKKDIIFKKSIEMYVNIFNTVGLSDNQHKVDWARRICEQARIFARDDARDTIDLDGYRYALNKIFHKSMNDGCSRMQYNLRNELLLLTIRLFACKFHGKVPYRPHQ